MVARSEIILSVRYKCVVVYKNKILSRTTTIKELNTTSSFTLTSNNIIKDVGYVTTDIFIQNITSEEKYKNAITYSWLRYDKSRNPLNDESDFFEVVKNNVIVNNHYQTKIRFLVNRIEDFNLLYCSSNLSYLDNFNNIIKKFIGTQTIGLYTSVNDDYILTINNDKLICKYDTNGDILLELRMMVLALQKLLLLHH